MREQQITREIQALKEKLMGLEIQTAEIRTAIRELQKEKREICKHPNLRKSEISGDVMVCDECGYTDY